MDRLELKRKLLDAGYLPDTFSVDDSWPSYEGFALRHDRNEWHVRYIERGKVTDVGRFDTETKACQFMYAEMRKSWPDGRPRT